jgi:hypothetical protein
MPKQVTRHVSTTHRWDKYVEEASKPDFVIEMPDGDPIVITNPDGEQALEARTLAAEGEIEDALGAICGDDVMGRLLPMLLKAPAGVMNALVGDVMSHFIGGPADQGNSRASSR